LWILPFVDILVPTTPPEFPEPEEQTLFSLSESPDESTPTTAGTQTAPPLTATPTPTQAPTAEPLACTFTASVNLFCRTGPGSSYPDIDSFTPGVMAPVVGMSSDGNYWYVIGPIGGRMCTVPMGDRFGSVTGDCSQQPVFTPMPLPPTVTPSPTACPIGGLMAPGCPTPAP
jgi:hypothetical protein